MPTNDQDFVATIGRIAVVPTILDVICRTTGMGFAAVARVTEDRWIACGVKDDINFGLKPGDELKIETTICNEIRQHGNPVVIDHVAEDPDFRAHHTPLRYGFQSYISIPIVLPGGAFFGTLYAIDPRPGRVDSPETIGMFKLFAELIAFHLDANEKLAEGAASLADERQNAVMREQFIAILGHDLRSPLAAIDAGVTLLAKEKLSARGASVITLLRGSVQRMSKLIEDVLDFARGRLGGGLPMLPSEVENIRPALDQVVAEMRASHPDHIFEAEFDTERSIKCDRVGIAQLFANLLGNAVAHGAGDRPIRAQATTLDDSFELSVTNAGEPISPDAMPRLFAPFSRGAMRPNQQGLGLGLYIASEIARAHGGTLTAASAAGETCFTFRMPLA